MIVGRGANSILPAATTLRIRLVAVLEDRVQVIARWLGLADREAATWVEKTKRQRLGFVQRYFGKDLTDPLHYDLVLNMTRLSAEDRAEMMIQMLRPIEGRGFPAQRKQQ